MTSETQIHVIARQMFEKHGPEAIAHAARNALASERRGDTEDALGMASCRGRHEDDAGTASGRTNERAAGRRFAPARLAHPGLRKRV